MMRTINTTTNIPQQYNNLYTSQQSQTLPLQHRRQAHLSQVFTQYVLSKEHITQGNLYTFPKHLNWQSLDIRYTSWCSLVVFLHLYYLTCHCIVKSFTLLVFISMSQHFPWRRWPPSSMLTLPCWTLRQVAGVEAARPAAGDGPWTGTPRGLGPNARPWCRLRHLLSPCLRPTLRSQSCLSWTWHPFNSTSSAQHR